MIIAGVDPGVTGAVVLYDPSKSPASGLRWVVLDMPMVGDKAELNAPVLRDFLRKYMPGRAFVEKVGAMPSIPGPNGARRGMGAASAFRFGDICGSIRSTILCCDVGIVPVTPQSWKKTYGLKGSDKEASRLCAVRLFPDLAPQMNLKKHHARAEAALIAAHGANRLGADRLGLTAA